MYAYNPLRRASRHRVRRTIGDGAGTPPGGDWWDYYPGLDINNVPFNADIVGPPDPPVTSAGPTGCADATACNNLLNDGATHVHITTSFAGNLTIAAADMLVTCEPGTVVSGTLTPGTSNAHDRIEVDGGRDSDGTPYAFADFCKFEASASGGAVIATAADNDHVVYRRLKIEETSGSGGMFLLQQDHVGIVETCGKGGGWGILTCYTGACTGGTDAASMTDVFMLGNNWHTTSTGANGATLRIGDGGITGFGGTGVPTTAQRFVLFENDFGTELYPCLRTNSIHDLWYDSNICRDRSMQIGNVTNDAVGDAWITNNTWYDTPDIFQVGCEVGPSFLDMTGNVFFTDDTDETSFDAQVGGCGPGGGEVWDYDPNTWNASTAQPGFSLCDASAL